MKKHIKRGYRVTRYIIYRETLIDYREKFWSLLGAYAGIGLIALLQSFFLPKPDNFFLIGSFGASSVLVYGFIESPLAQPRNLVGGHLVSAVMGMLTYKILPDIVWLTAPTAVSLSIIAMQYTKTLHPPGGATALIAVTGSAKIKALGFLYVIYPVLSGTLILLAVALIFNNLTAHRQYPAYGRFRVILKRTLRRTGYLGNRE